MAQLTQEVAVERIVESDRDKNLFAFDDLSVLAVGGFDTSYRTPVRTSYCETNLANAKLNYTFLSDVDLHGARLDNATY